MNNPLVGRAGRPAVFFDRDGVLNKDIGFLFESHRLVWIDGAREAVKAVNEMGYFAFVVTNQSGVARGLYQEAHVQELHDWMGAELGKIGAHIDAFEYCPFHPEASVEQYRRVSHRRKPSPGMIKDLLERFPVDLERSFLVGDQPRDLEAARAAGLKGYLFTGSNLEQFLKPLLQRS